MGLASQQPAHAHIGQPHSTEIMACSMGQLTACDSSCTVNTGHVQCSPTQACSSTVSSLLAYQGPCCRTGEAAAPAAHPATREACPHPCSCPFLRPGPAAQQASSPGIQTVHCRQGGQIRGHGLQGEGHGRQDPCHGPHGLHAHLRTQNSYSQSSLRTAACQQVRANRLQMPVAGR